MQGGKPGTNSRTLQNEQIDVALNSFLESKALKTPSNKLSDDGKDLVADSREVVRLMKYLFLSKNEGNLIQDFIWQTEQFDPNAVKGPNTPVDKQTAQQQGNEALEGLRTLGKLLITNGQFRKLGMFYSHTSFQYMPFRMAWLTIDFSQGLHHHLPGHCWRCRLQRGRSRAALARPAQPD